MPDKPDHSKSSSTHPKESNGEAPSIKSKPDSVIEGSSSSQKIDSPKAKQDADNWSHVSTIDGRGLSEKEFSKKPPAPPPRTAIFKQTDASEASDKSLSVISQLSSGVDESIITKSAHKSDQSVEHFIDDSSESENDSGVTKMPKGKSPVKPVRKSPQKAKTPKTPIQQQSPRPIHKKEPVKAIPNNNNKSVTPKAQTKSKNIVSVKSANRSSKSKDKSSKPIATSSASPSVSLTNSPTDGGAHNLPAPVNEPQVLSPIVRVSRFVAQPSPALLQSNPFIMYWNESVNGPIASHNFLAPKSTILVCRVANCAQHHSLLTVNFQQSAFYILVDHQQQTIRGANQQAQSNVQPQQLKQPKAVKSSKSRKEPKSPATGQ